VIGGGFIGSKLALPLCQKRQPSPCSPRRRVLVRMFPADLAHFLNDYYRARREGADGELVNGLEAGGEHGLKTKSGKEVQAGVIVAGLGILPNTRLAEEAGIQVDDGIVVDEHLRTSLQTSTPLVTRGLLQPGPGPAHARRARGQRLTMKPDRRAQYGRRPAALPPPAHVLLRPVRPGLRGGRRADPRLETYADWQEPFPQGSGFTTCDGRVRGVLLWNVWDKVEALPVSDCRDRPVHIQ
jgi:hypothetical protein